jgi:omega-hydroxy-beta-dihydromenaquinone-9 sulfotransferase
MSSAREPAKKEKKGAKNAYPLHAPRFWHGMTWGAWLRLIAQHQFRIHPFRWPMAAAITCITPFNSVMGALQACVYGNRIANQPIEQPPVFIIGHWRSGTTYLHELMSLDDRFGSPTTYQCFAPKHFLLTEWLIARYMGFLIPKQRPMDNMAAGWERPQEDEFALLALNAPTPYFRIAFPNDPPPFMHFLDMQHVPPEEMKRFAAAITYFVKLITYRTGKRLLLKSPPHTGRIEVLSRLFPGAKFVHITRDPYAIFSSTKKLWESLDDVQGLQLPHHRGLEDYIFTALEKMYGYFEPQRQNLPEHNFCQLRYEDLVKNPVERVAEIYQRLQLHDFSAVREKLAKFAGEQKDYQPNQHAFDPELKAKIRLRWSLYFEQFGYA